MEKITASHPLSKSEDMVKQNIELLKQLFPTIVKGGKVDMEELKALLGEEVETGEEYYRFTWAGKSQARQEANKPSTGTLRPVKEESKDWDTTQNIFIEGDNLEVLKLLQKSYAGKIKMIYIDPPYNTGSDFIYRDNYTDNLGNYLTITKQVDENGTKLSTNLESEGRFHSNWLNMIYPRLKLARNLLTEDGVIFISIDDNEAHNLRLICNEIFGEENLLAQFVWRTDGNFDNQAKVKNCHEYILAFCKKVSAFPPPPVIAPDTSDDSKLFKEEIRNTIVKNGPANPISEIKLPKGFPADFEEGTIGKRGNLWPHYQNDAIVRDGRLTHDIIIKSGWSSKDLLLDFINNGMNPIVDNKGQETKFIISKSGAVEVVKKRLPNQSHVISVLTNVGNTQSASAFLKKEGIKFDYPKPVQLIKYLMSMNEGKEYTILDFFSGSATTAHAAMQLNSEDMGGRKFILVQLPETIEQDKDDNDVRHETISEIAKERIRITGTAIKSSSDNVIGSNYLPDVGFRVFKLDSSNINAWDGSVEKFEQTLLSAAENIKEDRAEEDVLFEILLKSGLDLTQPIEEKTIGGQKVFNIGKGALFICLANALTTDIAQGIGKWKEELVPATCRVIFKDNGFNDVGKTNSIQILKRYAINEVNTI